MPQGRVEVDVRLPERCSTPSPAPCAASWPYRWPSWTSTDRRHRGKAVPGGAAVTVPIDRRPVAVHPAAGLGPEAAVEPLVEDILSRALRRLLLLAGPGVPVPGHEGVPAGPRVQGTGGRGPPDVVRDLGAAA